MQNPVDIPSIIAASAEKLKRTPDAAHLVLLDSMEDWIEAYLPTLTGSARHSAVTSLWRWWLHTGRVQQGIDAILSSGLPIDGDQWQTFTAFTALGILYQRVGEMGKAEKNLEMGLGFSHLLNLQDGYADVGLCYHWKSILHRRGGDLGSAILCNTEAIGRWTAQGDTWGLGSAYIETALIARERQDLTTACTALEKSAGYFEAIGDMYQMGKVVSDMAIVTAEQGELDKALAYERRATKIFQQEKDRIGEARSRNNCAMILHLMGYSKKALPEVRAAFRLMDGQPDAVIMPHLHDTLHKIETALSV